jgi:hypothetical protein
VVDLSLVRGAAAVPEEYPLESLIPLQLVLETELVLLVVELQQVQQLGGRLDDGEGRRLRVVDQHGDAAVGVQAQEPLLLLLVGHDVDERGRPLRAVAVGQFLQEDLRRLAVGRVLRDEVQALGLGHFLGRLGDVEMVGHGAVFCLCLLTIRAGSVLLC